MAEVTAFEEHAEEYDRWFDRNEVAYRAELEAVRRLLPSRGEGLEIGVGSGRFAGPLGVRTGIDPAGGLLKLARDRGVRVLRALGEHLPFQDGRFDFALLVTVICFVRSVPVLLREARRVLVPRGEIVIAFIDAASPLGRTYQSKKSSSPFYKDAHFYSGVEIAGMLRDTGFALSKSLQVLLPASTPGEQLPHEIEEGHGQGGFVVFAATKQ